MQDFDDPLKTNYIGGYVPSVETTVTCKNKEFCEYIRSLIDEHHIKSYDF